MICKAEIVAGLGAEPRAALMELAQRMEARALAALEDLRSETTEPVTSVEPGQTWVTRRGIGVDRMASAWLIRRSIDPQATFRFESDDFVPKDGELRFDMYEGEFTHVADLCTFEVLVDTFVPGDPVLTAIGEVVHDIDLKDALFKRPETVGVAALIEGIQATQHDDDARLARGFLLFDELHAALERRLSLMTD